MGISVALACLAGAVFAQRGLNRPPRPNISDGVREMAPGDRKGLPEWEIDPHFKKDVFTFARIEYNASGMGGGGWREPWMTDYPDSDLNFSIRLQQLTSLKVNPRPVILQLTDEALFDYPFIYMLEIQRLFFDEEEVTNLRRYLLNGGFLMVDDFWGDAAWANLARQMERVLPDYKPVELSIDHPIFHAVFDLKEKPQIPGIDWARSYGPNSPSERFSGPPHYRAWFDDKGRMMAIACQNTDLGDGWEREGEEEWYFHQYSEKQAYPMGINIVFYAMTH
jgi:hypothetical protein